MKKSFHVDVIITDGSRRGVVLTVKRTGRGNVSIFDRFDRESTLSPHLTIPKNGRIHETLTPSGANSDHTFWPDYDAPLIVCTEFRVSDPGTWGRQPRARADERIWFDVRSHVAAGKPDILTAAAALPEAGESDPLQAFSNLGDVLQHRVIEHIGQRPLAIAICVQRT